MDAKIWVPILCTHSQYVIRLATELTLTLRTLEQVLNEQIDNPVHTTMDGYGEKIAELRRLLTMETNMFCQRFNAFVEQPRMPYSEDALLPQGDRSILSKRGDDSQSDSDATVPQQRTSRETEFSQRVQILLEDSRAALASADYTFARTRTVLQHTEELFQSVRASRERADELKAQVGMFQLADSIPQEDHSPPERAPSAEPVAINKVE